MADTFPLLIGAVLANNLVLAQFFGGCPFFDKDGGIENLKLFGFSNVAVLALSALTLRLLDQFLLAPFDLQYLHFVMSIVLIAAFVQFADMSIRARDPATHRTFSLNLQLNATGCGVFGIALLEAGRPAGFVATFFGALCIAVAFTLAIASFAALRARLDQTTVPAALRGTPIMLIVIGLTALALTGLQGVGS
jgi:electron transport complex protein RnfA